MPVGCGRWEFVGILQQVADGLFVFRIMGYEEAF